MSLTLRSRLLGLMLALLMGAMGVIGLGLIWSRARTHAWMKLHNRILFRLAARVCDIRIELRGPVPQGAVVVAAKHQSMLDVLVLFNALPRAQFVMKRSLLWVPVFGLYAWRIGSTPVDRRGGGAGAQVLDWAERSGGAAQLVIYPQGTRVAPGAVAPYRRGAAMIYERMGLPLVLVATNAGEVWPKHGPRRPGTVVVEFLETLPPGLPRETVMARMEAVIEAASARLSVLSAPG